MNIVYLGSGQFGICCLDAIAESKHNLRLIVTQPAKAAGRGRKSSPTPAARWAAENSVNFIETSNANDPEILEQITAYRPEFIIVVAFGQKIGEQLIDLPPKGIINVHASLLPKYRGAAPINQAVINGEKQTGISIITVVEKIDAGKILSQAETNIGENENASQLHDRLAQLAAPILIQTIDKIENGTAVYREQDETKVTLAPKLKKSDGFLDFNISADLLRKKILGLWPWPKASAIYVSKQNEKQLRVSIADADVVETPNPDKLSPGTFDANLNVICGSDSLRIKKIMPAGAALMNFGDFVNGRAAKPGDLLTKIEE